MKYVRIIFLFAMVLALACGPKVAVKIVGAEDPGDKEGADVAQIADGSSRFDAPAQKFEPRSVPFKQRDGAMLANISSMPPLQMRLGECYGIYDDDGSLQVASGSGSGSVGAASGAVRKPKNGKSKSKPASRRAPKKRSGAKNSGSSLDNLLGGGAPRSSSATESKMSAPSPVMDKAAESAPAMEEAPAESVDMADAEGEMDDAELQMAKDEAPLDEYENWGASIYLSNDDSMSLSSAQRVMYAIDSFLPLPAEHIRPHELLNYFTFDTADVAAGHDFSVYPDVMADGQEEGVYTLGLAVSGRTVTKKDRRNVALTWVIDRSGSMQSEGRMEYLKRGLYKSMAELKRGDMIHMVLFDHNVCTPVENFVVGRDNMDDLKRAIDALRPMGSTDLHAGLTEGYAIADRSYQGHHSNRVVLITDALTNTGVTDERLISMISKFYDTRRIRLSGVGVGREFNDALLDKLTEKGKGAYVFLGSDAEVDAVFGPGFISLVETVALDVHFRLHLPKSLRMNVFYGEESSVHKEDVQAIHYFANTSQLFLSDVIARGGELRPQDDIMLTIEYQDPESGDEMVEEYAFNLKDVMKNEPYNTRKGKLIIAWIDMLAVMAERGAPSRYSYAQNSWMDDEAYALCEDGKAHLNQLAKGLEEDAESRRVLQLWDKYCLRYATPVEPEKPTLRKRTPKWPGARPEEER
ncbi:MAG: VWA domain-containing protein [Deltaproteobacteria bacterium]|nr:VWA domain-containing protein [Deltaproteobacteria bacterium]